MATPIYCHYRELLLQIILKLYTKLKLSVAAQLDKITFVNARKQIQVTSLQHVRGISARAE